MLTKDILQFLKELSENNNKEWFQSQRNRYVTIKEEFTSLIDTIIPAISSFDSKVKLLTSKDCLFRINRDTRFSNNKDPYKNNMGAFIAHGGRNSLNPGYYIHLEPGNCFLSGGIYMPQPNVLKAIRTEIYENPLTFKKIINNKAFKETFGDLWAEDKLKTAPVGFPRDFKDIELLKLKHYVVMYKIKDKFVSDKDYPKKIVEIFKKMYIFNKFFYEVIDYIGND